MASNTPNKTNEKKRKRQWSLEERVDVLRRMEKGEKAVKISRELGIPEGTLSGWKKDKEKIIKAHGEAVKSGLKNRVRVRDSAMPEVDEALLFWLKQMRCRKSAPAIDLSSMMAKAQW